MTWPETINDIQGARGSRLASSVLRFTVAALAACFIAVLINRYYFGAGVYSISADESIRAHQAYKFFLMKWPVEAHMYWPPGLAIITGTAYHFYMDLFATPRVIALLFGLVYVLAVALLTREIFRDKVTTIIALFVSVAFSERVVLTLVPLAELPSAVFFLFSFTCYLRHVRGRFSDGPDTGAILFANACMACAFAAASGLIRYEYWLWMALLGISLFLMEMMTSSKQSYVAKFVRVAVYAVILCAVPVFLVANNYFQHGDMFEFLSIHTKRYLEFHPDLNMLRIRRSIPSQLLYEVLSCGLVLGVIAIPNFIRSWAGKRSIFFAAIGPVCVMILVQGVLALSGVSGTHNFWRQAFTYTTLSLPFVACAMRICSDRLSSVSSREGGPCNGNRIRRYAVISVLMVLFAMLNYQNMTYLTERASLRLDQNLYRVGSRVKQIVQQDENYLHGERVILTNRLSDRMNMNMVASLRARIIDGSKPVQDYFTANNISMILMRKEDEMSLRAQWGSAFQSFVKADDCDEWTIWINKGIEYQLPCFAATKALSPSNPTFEIMGNELPGWGVGGTDAKGMNSSNGVLCLDIESKQTVSLTQEKLLSQPLGSGSIFAEIEAFTYAPGGVSAKLVLYSSDASQPAMQIPLDPNREDTLLRPAWRKYTGTFDTSSMQQNSQPNAGISSYKLVITASDQGGLPVMLRHPHVYMNESAKQGG